MALVSFLPPDRRPIPHEPGQWMEFQKPTGPIASDARRIAEADGRKGVQDFGVEIVKALQDGDDDDVFARRFKRLEHQKELLEREQEYYPTQFDRDTLLKGCVKAWSYTDHEGRPVKVTPQTIADLDEATARWAHHTIVELMTPNKEADKSTPEGPLVVPLGAGSGAEAVAGEPGL